MLKVIVSGIAVLTQVKAWSRPSHCAVALEAAQKLTPVGVQFVAAHLHEFLPPAAGKTNMLRERVGKAMAEVSGWADTVTESYDYHFSHTDYQNCRPFDIEQDCPRGRCLVTGILRYIAEASDFSGESKDRVDAIKFLIHLIADATQPLHTGFAEDSGAMKIQVVDPAVKSLHVFWDFDLPAEYWKQTAGLEAVEDLPVDGFAAALVSQTSATVTCEKGYKDEMGDYMSMDDEVILSPAYVKDRVLVAGLQLKRAAHYLAQILNEIAERWRANFQKSRVITPVTTPPPDSLESENKYITLAADLLPLEVEESASARSESPSKKRREKTEVLGVDLKTITIKNLGKLILVTSKTKADVPKYTPTVLQEFDVAFGPVSKRVVVDRAVFTLPLTNAHIGIIFEYFKREPVAVASVDRKIDAMFERAKQEKVTIGEGKFEAPPMGIPEGQILVFAVGKIVVAIDENDVKRDRLTFAASDTFMQSSINTGTYLAIISDNLIKGRRKNVGEEVGKQLENPAMAALVEKCSRGNRRFFTMLHHLEYYITGVQSDESKRLPGLITELNRLDFAASRNWDSFEVVYSNDKSTVFDLNTEDMIFFALGPKGIGLTAKHLLHSQTDMTFELEKLRGDEGLMAYIDSRLSTSESLNAAILRLSADDVDALVSFDEIAQTRQWLALKETSASMFNLLSDSLIPRRAMKRYFTEKDKDGNPVRFHVILKGNLGK